MHLVVDGSPVPASPGQSVAAALLAAGILWLRCSPRTQAPRGAFCLMGTCQECVLRIDGLARPACQVAAQDGMAVALACVELARAEIA